MFRSAGRAYHRRYAPDLLTNRGLRIISRLSPFNVVASFVGPLPQQ
jgi:hypothetical protein